MTLTCRRNHRIEIGGQARFLTFSCHRRLPLFKNDLIKDAFAEILNHKRLAHQFCLFAWVVMPEHVHLLLLPCPTAPSLAPLLSDLKSTFARHVINRWKELDAPILKQLKGRRGKYQFWLPGGGYDRTIYSDHEFSEKVNYIHTNPVRRGLTKHPNEWKWSSANWYAGKRESGIPMDPWPK